MGKLVLGLLCFGFATKVVAVKRFGKLSGEIETERSYEGNACS
jgi:hypothetical protein